MEGLTYKIATGILGELDYEITATRKCLERIPADLFDYKPHAKSMSMGRLATHLSEMANWITMSCRSNELDMAAQEYKPFVPTTTAELVRYFEGNFAEAAEALKNTPDQIMHEDWTFRNGDQIYFTITRIAMLRTMCLNHLWHHRGQLTVYLRMNGIPVPSVYGPSADEGQM